MSAATINPTCHACLGTGEDQAFGGACSECARHGFNRIADPAEFIMATGEAMQRGHSHAGGGAAGQPVPMATDKQIGYMHKLLRQLADHVSKLTPDQRAAYARIDAASDHPMSKRAASDFIDMLTAMAPTSAASGAVSAQVRRNAHPGTCGRCGQHVAAQAGLLTGKPGAWVVTHDGDCPSVVVEQPAAPVVGLDLTPLKAFTSNGLVRFAVPGGTTRLKVRVKFSKSGTIYVDDAAEYGQGSSYGSQRPGQSYRGQIESALVAILADPAAAIVAYTELVGRCGICNRHLEAGESVATGVGPVCAKKIGLA